MTSPSYFDTILGPQEEPAIYTSGITPMNLLIQELEPPVPGWPNDWDAPTPAQNQPLAISPPKSHSWRNIVAPENEVEEDRMEASNPARRTTWASLGYGRDEPMEDELEEDRAAREEREERAARGENDEDEEGEEGEEMELAVEAQRPVFLRSELEAFVRDTIAVTIPGEAWDHFRGWHRKRLLTDDNMDWVTACCERKWDAYCSQEPEKREFHLWGFKEGDEDLTWKEFNEKRWRKTFFLVMGDCNYGGMGEAPPYLANV